MRGFTEENLIMNTKEILVNGFCVAAVAVSVSAQAAESVASYPSRPIRMLVPNAPGSSVDTLSFSALPASMPFG